MRDKLKAKIKLPHIDEDDFPYKFYKCFWKDIQSDSSWSSLNNIKKLFNFIRVHILFKSCPYFRIAKNFCRHNCHYSPKHVYL